MPEIVVRNAIPEDAAAIAAFNIAMAAETEDKALPADVIRAGVDAMLADPELGFYLVAEVDGSVQACLAITFEWSDWRNGLFWWIQSVYVMPDARRLGVFRQLYDTVCTRAQEQADVCGVRLYVEKENVRAQQTYQNLGMVETDYKLYEIEFDQAS